jgi:CubicO group peptidase (beta-lactamase class C family)/acetyl esterase/lipase
MRRYLLFFCLFFMSAGMYLNAQSSSYSPETEDRIRLVENSLAGWVQTGNGDTWSLAERMKKYNINGVSIAVIHNYRIDWAKGYGFADVSEQRPVNENTLFQAASISKSLNSVGILKLVQEKKLDLNTDINNYLVSWKFPYDTVSKGKIITLTNLLSHTGGLSVSGFPGYEKGNKIPTIPEILDGAKPANTHAVRSIKAPGLEVIYSGGGITISQLILMDVTKQPYNEYMKENVLDPLGMTNSSFTQPPPASKEKMLATGYLADGKEINGKYHIYPEQGAAGLWTTPSDLCRYIIETQLAFNGNSSRVLTQEMTKVRLTPVIEDAALGTWVNSRVTGSFKYFNHNGGNEGFCCTAIGCENSGDGVVIMTNTDHDNTGILEEIANSVATVYHWKDYYLPEKKNVIQVDPDILSRYAGTYDLGGRTIKFKTSPEGLLVNIFGDLYYNVLFTSENEFFIREYRGNLKFISDKDNHVTGFLFNGTTAKRMAPASNNGEISIQGTSQQESNDQVHHIQEVYKTVDTCKLKIDIFYTDQCFKRDTNTAIVFFHGGGWAFGSPDEFFTTCERYARMGLVTFSVEYRLSIENGITPSKTISPIESVLDARSAIRWVRGNAGKFHIGINKIVAAGQSAGGHLALCTAMIDEYNEQSDDLSISCHPDAVLLFSACINAVEGWCDRLLDNRRTKIWSISPAHHIHGGLPPMIDFHGTDDEQVPIWTAQYFETDMKKEGNYFELHQFTGRKHYLGDGNPMYSRYYDDEILNMADDFLRKFNLLH